MKSPDQIFGQLFYDLHTSGLWPDGKVISDAIPITKVDEIIEKYDVQKELDDFDLRIFFEQHFRYNTIPTSDFVSDTSKSTEEHISRLWDHLSRSSDTHAEGSSLIPLPNKYVVPGGRFNEIYYWDSYFTMLGLVESGRIDMVESMIENFAWQINTIGFIPNGNRTYFLGRSQPAFFSLMINLLANVRDDSVYLKYKDTLIKEYTFWNESNKELEVDKSSGHVIRLVDGKLNRYFDKYNTPRPEMFGDDTDLKSELKTDNDNLFAHLRAACESGWDFSSRWLDSSQKLSTIQTLNIIPVDLNCLLYNLELTISKCFQVSNDEIQEKRYYQLAEKRSELIRSYFWSDKEGFFFDYDFTQKHLSVVKSLAAVFPLYFNIATDLQADRVRQVIEQEFLKPGGVVTTNIDSGQQWDAPNGWAPLQYMTVKALLNYGYKELANEIKERWLSLNDKVFKNTGKMLEKYNVVDTNLLSGGGEYPVQDGFGWTNGVYLFFKNL